MNSSESKELKQEKPQKQQMNNFFSSELTRLQSYESRQSSPSKAQPNPRRQIQQTRSKLDSAIQDLNSKLFDHFHKKEQQLLEQYKQQLIVAQKELNKIKSTTNEQQIKNKMLERKKQLQKERFELIQTNMFFSNKCEQYKKKLSDLVGQGKQLEREIVFLDQQMEQATKRKFQIMTEVGDNTLSRQQSEINVELRNPKMEKQKNTLPLFTQKKKEEIPSTNRTEALKKPSYSTFEKPTGLQQLANSSSNRSNLKKKLLQSIGTSNNKKNLIRNFDWVNLQSQDGKIGIGASANYKGKNQQAAKVFDKTPLQKLFEETVEEIKSKRKQKRMPSLKGEQFTDLEKRIIMEQFLSKEEVKKKIYQIIFESAEEGIGLNLADQSLNALKVKIAYQDINN